eukprot:gene11452-biopygen4994
MKGAGRVLRNRACPVTQSTPCAFFPLGGSDWRVRGASACRARAPGKGHRRVAELGNGRATDAPRPCRDACSSWLARATEGSVSLQSLCILQAQAGKAKSPVRPSVRPSVRTDGCTDRRFDFPSISFSSSETLLWPLPAWGCRRPCTHVARPWRVRF